MTEPRFDPAAVTLLLSRHRVHYVVIGGVAATLHGSPVLTGDVDIAYERTRENIERLAEALAEVHARLRGVDEDLPFKPDAATLMSGSNFTFVTDLGNVDCLGWVEGIKSYEALSQRAIVVELSGESVKVASIDDLIAMKRAAGREKDRIGISHLETIKEMTQ